MISVSVKIPPRGSVRPAPRGTAGIIGRAWAAEVDSRVLAGGRPEGGKPGLADHGPIRVAPGYAHGGQPSSNGADIFASSAGLRSGPGYATTSGGMRRGLVVKAGGFRAVVEFSGSSLGAVPVWVGGRATGVSVSNAEKAATVLGAHARNVLELGDAEMRAIRDAAESWAERHVEAALGGRVRWHRRARGRSAMARRMMRE